MKKRSFFLGLATIVALSNVFTACSSDDSEIASAPQQSSRIRLTSSVSNMTRATDQNIQSDAIKAGAKVGVFAESGSTPLPNGTNNQYTVESNGDLTATNEMTWPTTGTVNIYAYAPYQNGWTMSEAQEFTVSTDQSEETGYLASDLLYGTPATNGVSKTDEAVVLKFNHKLAKLNISFTVNDETDLKGATVKVLNTKTKTSLNLSTGDLVAPEDGQIATITAATFASDATTFNASVIIVPQEIASGTKFVQIDLADGTKSYTAQLENTTNFESTKSYTYTVTFGAAAARLRLVSTSSDLKDWDGDTNAIGNTAQEVEGPVTYGIGDYLLADGTLVKANKLTDDQTPAAIIFSTTVSTTDATAGYGAYAMALKRYKNRVFHADATNTAKMATGAGTWHEGLNDLDGRTNTETMLASTYYAARTDEEKTASVINLSGFTPALSGTTNSGWFLPSFGQMIQIMNAFGEAGITEATVTVPEAGISSQNAFYTSETGALTTLVNNIKANVPKADADLFAVGAIVYATSTENNSTSSSHLQKYWAIQCAAGDTWALGKNIQRKADNRSVIPVTAVKLPEAE